ncbi:cytochrome P450 family protein [Fictibacillus gelatini]|uniref:cytochrome P450 family protein n=1 Tax=Fictibacillus gelatini TaxID=225985 RepID=UPI000410E823
MTMTKVFHLFSPEYKSDPYGTLAYYREHDPVHAFQLERFDRPAWLITRYSDAVALLKDTRVTKDFRKLMSEEQLNEFNSIPEMELISNHMLAKDPPDHTRLRTLVHKAFTPKMISDLRGRIQEIANELLDKMAMKQEVDLLNEYAFPLPMTVISEMLGIPEKDREQFRMWSNVIIDVSNKEEQQEANPYIKEFVNYLEKLIEERKERPQSDLVSGLALVEEEGEKLTKNELYSMIFLLIIAGHETTVNLIGNGTLALLEHPDQLEKLRAQPELIQTAVEELLRYTNPVEFATFRMANEDFDLHGKKIKKGDAIMIGIASANRDPSCFENPDSLDLTRKSNQHIAFGFGIHYCLGAPLARLEGQIAINSLIQRFPEMCLNASIEELKWRSSLILRGLVELPVKLWG